MNQLDSNPNGQSTAAKIDAAVALYRSNLGVPAMSVESQDVNAESAAAEAVVKAASQSNEPQSKQSSWQVIVIDDWRQAWRFFSLWFISIAGILQSTWDVVPPDIRASMPAGTLKWVTIVLLVLGGVGRFIKQVNQPEGASE
jgi:hypothetical protein